MFVYNTAATHGQESAQKRPSLYLHFYTHTLNHSSQNYDFVRKDIRSVLAASLRPLATMYYAISASGRTAGGLEVMVNPS